MQFRQTSHPQKVGFVGSSPTLDTMSNEDYKKFLQDAWDGKKPIWVFCPICEEILEGDGCLNGFGKRTCKDCKYEYQQQGSYASRVTINGQSFGLDDMFDDSDKMYHIIAELKWLRENQ